MVKRKYLLGDSESGEKKKKAWGDVPIVRKKKITPPGHCGPLEKGVWWGGNGLKGGFQKM